MKERIIMLGTGAGITQNLYNTCFLLDNGEENLLVDTGGGIDIVKNLKQVGYELKDIHNIFISHCHTDHILGLIWVLKILSVKWMRKQYSGNVNIYGNQEVSNAIKVLIELMIPKGLIRIIEEHINIVELSQSENIAVAGYNINFFDLQSKGNQIHGFDTILKNGKRLLFLGDEPCKETFFDRLHNADYVMHEVYCMDSEEKKFCAYELKKSTIKTVCEVMKPLNVKNLILFHTEDTHRDKTQLYSEEAKKYFDNNVIIPNDGDIIELI